MLPPIMDSTSGRSYLQANQTPGALGGRRDVVQWYSTEGGVPATLLCACWLSTSVRWGVWNTGGGSVWDGEQLVNGYGSADADMGCRALTSNLWFIFSWNSDDTWDGTVQRSEDAGASWTVLPLPETNYDWQDIVRAPDGRLWATTQLDRRALIQRDIKIWYSDDDGDTWVESHAASLNYQEIYYMAVHPTDSDIIVAFGYGAGGAAITYITKNRGSTWTQNVATGVHGYSPLRGHEAEIIITTTGRLIQCAHEVTTTNAGIMVSDDDGVSWTFKVTKDIRASSPTGPDRMLGPVQNVDSSRIFCLWNDGSEDERYVLESTDDGDTWVQYDSEVPYEYPVANNGGNGGIAYDPVNDTIYIGNTNPSGDGLKIIMKMSPALAVGGVWVDASGDLDNLAVPAFRFENAFGQRIAAIPA